MRKARRPARNAPRSRSRSPPAEATSPATVGRAPAPGLSAATHTASARAGTGLGSGGGGGGPGGREGGWQVRFEREFSDEPTLLVATEGILAARMQSDPLLAGFRTVVLDEFHERSVHADLGLALLREALEARDELRVLVMSATLEAAPGAGVLGGATVIEVQGRPHPGGVEWAPGLRPAAA